MLNAISFYYFYCIVDHYREMHAIYCITLFDLFKNFESEAKRLIEAQCVLPAYEMVLKSSHTFNLLDARGAISVTERVGVIKRVRDLAVGTAKLWADQQQEVA